MNPSDAAKLTKALAHGLPPAERRRFNEFARGELKERCPTCGEPVASIFDHVDKDCGAN